MAPPSRSSCRRRPGARRGETPWLPIWVIDDDASSRELLARLLASRGWQVDQLADGREALDRLEAGAAPDLVISDIRMAEVDGLAVTEAFRRDAPATPVILVTAFGNVDGAVEAIRRGAFDYVSKPYDVDAVLLTAERALEQRRLAEENRTLRRQLRDKYRLENAVGRSEAMLQVFKTAARVAASDATVLILGETGTGKELVARALHQSSPRAAGPFVAGRLRRDRRGPARVRALRPRARSVHGRAERAPGALRGGRAAGRSSSTRSATSARACRPGSCARCRRGPSGASARTRRSRSTCASSPRRTATSRRR